MAGAQEIEFCGTHTQLPAAADGAGGPAIYDRFGNVYSAQELSRLQSQGVLVNCNTTDIFQLTFVGDFPADEQQTICAVFEYVSGLVAGGSTVQVPIILQREPMTYGAPAAASDFFTGGCGLVNSSVLELVRTGQNTLPVGVAAGIVHVRENPTLAMTWFTQQDEQIAPITAQEVDLYSVVLHEALHILGIASLVGLDGTPLGASNFYSNWDRFLTGGVDNAPLLVPDAAGGDCCNAHTFNTAAFPGMPAPLDGGCTINVNFRVNGANIAPVNSVGLTLAEDNDMANKLSHLDQTCGTEDYVMHPGIDPGDIRRFVTPAELNILCNLGYPTASCSQNCTVIAQDDHWASPIILTGIGATLNPIFIHFTGIDPINNNPPLLANDAVPTGAVPAYVGNCGQGDGISVQPAWNGVFVTGITPGIWTFCYSLSGCNGEACDEATVTVIVLETAIDLFCQNSSCNLACVGDFEMLPVVDNDFHTLLGLPAFVISSGAFGNSVDVVTENMNEMIRFGRGFDNGTETECPRIPLSAPIMPGCTTTINLRAASAPLGVVPNPAPRLQIFGISGAPCATIPEPMCPPTGPSAEFQLCPGVQALCMGSTPIEFFPDEQAARQGLTAIAPITVVNNTTFPITDLLLLGGFEPGAEGRYVYFVDDLVVTSSCRPQISINPTVLEQCTGGQAVIQYEVCVEDAPPNFTADLELQALLPNIPGLTVQAGGGFNAAGQAGLSFPEADGTPYCATLTLTLDIPANILPGTQITIGMNGTSPQACIDFDGSDPEAVLTPAPCEPDPLDCDCPAGGTVYTLGTDETSVTLASLSPLAAVAPDGLGAACIAVRGRLVWDIEGVVELSRFILNRGAEIVVEGGYNLELRECVLEGCENMWRGLTVRPGADLRLERCSIFDAQYAVRAAHLAEIRVVDNRFDRNHVGLYVAPASGPQAVETSAITGNRFTCSAALLAPYDQQTPDPGALSYAAAELHDAAGYTLGAGNVADGLANGVLAFRSAFAMERCTVLNLVEDLNTISLLGVLAQHCAQAVVTDCDMDRVGTGISAVNSNLTARGNEIRTIPTLAAAVSTNAIEVIDGTNRLIRIQDNTVTAANNGILVQNCWPAAGLRVRDNTVDLFPGANTGRAGISLAHCRTGWVRINTINNAAGDNPFNGISLLDCEALNVLDNRVYDQLTGIAIYGGRNHYLYRNRLENPNYTGAFGATGVYAANTVNRYCDNLTAAQSATGFWFEGACSPSRLTCNTIGDAGGNGLELWADWNDPSVGTLLGEQLNRGNAWTGTYGGGNGFGAFNAAQEVDVILDSRFTMPSADMPTWSTAAGQNVPWFSESMDAGPNCFLSCGVPVDPVDDNPNGGEGGGENEPAGPIDVDVASGNVNGEGIRWMAQWRLYERLREQPEMAGYDNALYSFAATTEGTFGAYYDLNRQWEALQGRDPYSQHQLTDLQAELAVAFAQLQSVRANTSLSATARRNQARQFGGLLAWLMRRYYAIEAALEQARLAEADALVATNENLPELNDVCADNLKTLHYLALKNGLWRYRSVPAPMCAAIKSIADQCPMQGGFAVYTARAIYKYFDAQAA